MEKYRNQNCKVMPYDIGNHGGVIRQENRQTIYQSKKPYDLNTTSLSERACKSKHAKLK